MRFLHTRGKSPMIVAKTAQYQILPNGQVFLVSEPVFVRFSGATATVLEDDPYFQEKVAACEKADWIIKLGEDPRKKMAQSTEPPVAVSPIIKGAPGEAGIAPTGPPVLKVKKGAVAPPVPTKEDAEKAKREEM